jgi:hypothetical protein
VFDFRYGDAALRARAGGPRPPQFRHPSRNRLKFRLFVDALTAFEECGDLKPLPPFHVSELHCWRAFVSVYPRSVRFLEAVIAHKPGSRDTMFASALLSVLALADADDVVGAAHAAQRSIMPLLSGDPANRHAYSYQRELFRGLVESGDGRLATLYAGKLIDLVDQHPAWEQWFLTGYGWDQGSLQANLQRKLLHPARRDAHLRPLYETMEDLRVRGFRRRPAQSAASGS